MAKGKPDAEIAGEIGGTVKQIAAQRERLLARLGISSDIEIREAAKTLAGWPYRKAGADR